ncbi:hypothetical protein OOZ15_01835 [Galbibacter sp. EGI 63066]|uniref:hypothetical protein n=1 Tax=Galbibacter sp. EGI 63066 TaxID=2993559 RepID=UPI002248B9F0|nr:hypothetical protein [Galbibacter sp. EGI 63066]MCX2678670.1 hypothetical protein [Galbibacter sp. EGI 63066]
MRHFLIKKRILLLFSCWGGGITFMYAGSGLFIDPTPRFYCQGNCVSETDNQPLPGATVIVKGTSEGLPWINRKK